MCLSFVLPAQNADRELIVRWASAKAAGRYAPAEMTDGRWLAEGLRIQLLSFPSTASRDRAQKSLTGRRGVVALEPNRVVTSRTEPNDSEFDQQRTNLERAGYPDAWDLTPGGRTTDNQEIVVAILDAGFDINHRDLAANLWVNPAEARLDGVDNDGNGYVDDIHGWNMIDRSPFPPLNTHGTQVIGLIGAKGNNGIGVSGTNWDVKMMLLSISTSADIIEAYEYIRNQRRLYNNSDGAEGALVVATNASFGIEGGTCAQYPVWGGLYDDLGRQGILTAASTSNRQWDVELNGDMPTDCTSEYLLGVTNLGENDLLYRSSGYGRLSVDLGAPGEGSHTTRPGNSYGAFGSTSAAAPYVTGAVALMYATPCEQLLERIKNDPSGAALLVRDAILEGVAANGSLLNRTVTGGVLNVAESQRLLVASCNSGAMEDFRLTGVTPNPATDQVRVTTNALVFSDGARAELFDALGRLARSQPAVRVDSNPIVLEVNVAGLPAGAYLLRVTERDRVGETMLVVW